MRQKQSNQLFKPCTCSRQLIPADCTRAFWLGSMRVTLITHACSVYHVSLDCTWFIAMVRCSRVAAILCIASNLEINGSVLFAESCSCGSINSNPWEGNALSLDNSWEPGKCWTWLIILKGVTYLHYSMIYTWCWWLYTCSDTWGTQYCPMMSDYAHVSKYHNAASSAKIA